MVDLTENFMRFYERLDVLSHAADGLSEIPVSDVSLAPVPR